MMKQWLLPGAALVVLAVAGCGGDGAEGTGESYIAPADPASAPKGPGGGGAPAKADDAGSADAEEESADDSAPAGDDASASEGAASGGAAIDGGSVQITPATSRIVFVGKHTDKAKDDRTGGFEQFNGTATVADGKVTALEVEIDVNSVFTFNDGLTTHLKNADFFDTNEYPNAKFVSKSIADDGTVTGDLTLHGVTKEISFPASIEVADNKLMFSSDFQVNRFDFGMNGVKDGVVGEVDMKIAVGQPTDKAAVTGGGRAAGGRGGRGGGRGGFTVESMLERFDGDGDGVLKGDEIPDRMRQGLDRIDTDGNGEVSKEELEAMMANMGGGRRGGGGRQ